MLRRCIYSRPEHSSATCFFPLFLENWDKQVLSFTKAMIHNTHRLSGCITSVFIRLRKKWPSLQTVGWSANLWKLTTYLKIYICLHFPDHSHFSISNKQIFFSHLTQPYCSVQSGRLERTFVLPTQNICC